MTGFHYPSTRAVLTGRVDGPSKRPVLTEMELIKWKPVTRQLGPLTRVVETGLSDNDSGNVGVGIGKKYNGSNHHHHHIV